MKQTITFIKGDKVDDNTDYRDALPVNISAVSRPIFGIKGYMLQDYGLTQNGEGFGVDRGGLWNERFNDHYRLSGHKVVSVTSDGVSTELGTINGSKTASFPYSFNTQGIVANGQFFLYDPVGGFREITDSDLGHPIDCVWVDGYYFFTDGEYIYHTNITNESEIDPLKFATAEFSPDITYGVAKTQDNKVMVFGRYTIEYFVNQATENFAFLRLPTRAIKVGIVGTHAKAELGGAWFILGGRKEEGVGVHAVTVGSANKVSSREVDKIIGEYSEEELRYVVGEARAEDDSNYIVVHLPDYVLEFNSDVAHAAGSSNAWTIKKTGTKHQPWRAKHGIFDPRLGKWVYGDKIDSRFGILDESVGTQYGEIAEWILYTPFIYLETMSIDQLGVEIMPGHTFEADAVVAVSLSYNGVTYGKEWFANYGLPQVYGQRFEVKRLGYVRNWVGFKLRGATRSRMAFSKGEVEYS